MKHQGYYTRALKANDPRFARVFGKMGYGRSDMVADDQVDPVPRSADDGGSDALTALREEYQRVVGKRAFHGWDAAELRTRIDDAAK